MGLEFNGDAICLSGLTGSRLKCDVIGRYYAFWWGITSGGARANYQYATAIVEMDAATGEVYIEDTGETILGSSGHALALKLDNKNARYLRIVLVERDPDCYDHLKKVINRRWKTVNISVAEGPLGSNGTGVYLLNKSLAPALQDIMRLNLGNALFFFDPLRGTEYAALEQVAKARMGSYYKTGTEIIAFLFTSDWFLGRNDFKPLPSTADETKWSDAERKTVHEADALLGTTKWHPIILTAEPIHQREEALVDFYREQLHRWFRYVLPMPFNPKLNQIFHLILCSNYELGVKATRDFYCDITDNQKYSPDNSSAYQLFRTMHADIFSGLSSKMRPLQWRMLWKIISGHEEGISDSMCADFSDIGNSVPERQQLLDWLEQKDYLQRITNDNAWGITIPKYRLNWPTIKERLGVSPPVPFKPLSLKPLSIKEINN